MVIIHLNFGNDYQASVIMIESNLFNIEIHNIKSGKKHVVENVLFDTLPKDISALISCFKSKVKKEIDLINGVVEYVN